MPAAGIARWLAVGGGLGAVGMVVSALVLHATDPISRGGEGLVGFVWPVPFLAMALVGVVVASRRSGNPVGWLFLAAGLTMGLQAVAQQYATSSYDRGWGLPAAGAAAWLAVWGWAVSFALLPVIFTLFPTGRPPSRPWWGVIWLAAGAAVVIPFAALPAWSLRGPELVDFSLIDLPVANVVANGVVPLLLLASVVSVGVRYRRSTREVRQQLKWLAFSAGLMVLSFVVAVAVPTERPMDHALYRAVFLLAAAAIPIGAGVAILRYRLYDIDRIISRTVAYAVVFAVLAGVYAGSVLLLGGATRSLTGDSGDLVVALSTLFVAAAFRPVASRVRTAVDRRFNRARYDASRTAEAFGRALRDELDDEAIIAALRGAAVRNLEPQRLSVVLVPRSN